MKRIHLFEFEDLPWFPNWIRICMTRYIVAFHKLLGTGKILSGLVAKALPYAGKPAILDLCSGSGGPMIKVAETLKNEYTYSDLHLILSDLYPDKKALKYLNSQHDPSLTYLDQPLDAAQVDKKIQALRTLICSMHHMRPAKARQILKDAQESKQPILIYELSDNSTPTVLWWLAIPVAFVMVLLFTPMVRPMTWQQLVFTYLIPILPLFIAWDGAVSNARTYTIKDMEEIIKDLKSDSYRWEMGKIKGKAGYNIYLMGLPLGNN